MREPDANIKCNFLQLPVCEKFGAYKRTKHIWCLGNRLNCLLDARDGLRYIRNGLYFLEISKWSRFEHVHVRKPMMIIAWPLFGPFTPSARRASGQFSRTNSSVLLSILPAPRRMRAESKRGSHTLETKAQLPTKFLFGINFWASSSERAKRGGEIIMDGVKLGLIIITLITMLTKE